MACGFTVAEEALPQLRCLLGEYGRRYLQSGQVEKQITGDLELSSQDLTLENAEAIQLLAPFGQGNPQPLFALANVFLQEIQPLGKEGKHFRLALQLPKGDGRRGGFVSCQSVVKGLLFNVDQSLPLRCRADIMIFYSPWRSISGKTAGAFS